MPSFEAKVQEEDRMLDNSKTTLQDVGQELDNNTEMLDKGKTAIYNVGQRRDNNTECWTRQG